MGRAGASGAPIPCCPSAPSASGRSGTSPTSTPSGARSQTPPPTCALPDSHVGIPLAEFLPRLYAKGAHGVADAIAIHAYAPDVPGVLAVVGRARAIAAAHGDAATPIWITEYGWASAGEDSFITVDEAQQAGWRRLR